jgi:vacuolar-type H+-ATPase subunit H
MNIWGLGLVVGSLLLAAASFVWLAFKLDGGGVKKHGPADYGTAAEEEVTRIFNDEFREELRNRGRLHFEKIIGENAMFLQQDLRLTTSQLNEFMKQEITRTLQEEFAKYEQSIDDAKQMATDSIRKTTEELDKQRQALGLQLAADVAKERDRIIKRFEDNMADIVNHYIMLAIGNQIDLSDQLEFILSDLESNKQAIVEDVKNGA